MTGHDTPEAAAKAGMDPRCEILASASEGDAGYVLMNGGTDNYRYPYGINVVRRDGRWFEGSSDNGCCGWSSTSDAKPGEPNLGTYLCWGDVPDGVDLVRVRLRDEHQDVPVQNGVFLACWFHRPADDDDWYCWPVVEAMRLNGEWTKPDWPTAPWFLPS